MRFLSLIGLVIVLALSATALVSLLKSPPSVIAAERRGMATRKTTTGVGVIMPESNRVGLVARAMTFWQKVKAAFSFLVLNEAGALSLQAIRDEIATLRGQAEAVQNKADAEKRDLTGDELKQFDGFLAAAEAKHKELERRQRLEAFDAKLDAPGERKTRPQDAAGGARVTGGDLVAAKSGTHGFKNFGEFAQTVRMASRKAAPVIDERLLIQPQDAATTYGSEGIGADGGYLAPPDFRQELLTKVLADESLLARCMQINTDSNAVTFPANENEPWSASGIQAFWTGEATAPTQSKPAVRGLTVHVEKLVALVPVTDELLADASILQGFLMGFVPQKIDFQLNDAILNGSGVGKPQGILKSAALITVAKEAGQTAGTIQYNNATKMFARMRPANRRNAIWIANQDAEPQLAAMVVPPGTTGAQPAFLPAGGLSNAPFDTLLGRPIVYSEATKALGTPGDLVLADMSQYVAVVKGGGVRTDISIHLYFDQDVTAYRFVLRVGGKPWWNSTITRTGSKLSQSAYVAMDSTT
jgi:HK97 family phage major capsid protein